VTFCPVLPFGPVMTVVTPVGLVGVRAASCITVFEGTLKPKADLANTYK